MATPAHCIFCFETLARSLERKPLPALADVEASYAAYAASFAAAAPPSSTNTPPSHARRLADRESTTSSRSSSATPPASSSAASSATSLDTHAAAATTPPQAPAGTVTPAASPAFITWNTLAAGGKQLRGCIGTFEAHAIEEVLRDYALTAALHDSRFAPVTRDELPSLGVAVTLLTDFEPAADAHDWTLGTHGLRIAFTERGRRYGATYLPDVAVEQGWTQDETLVSLMRKAGWSGRRDDWARVPLQVTRYQGKKFAVDARVWLDWRRWCEESG